MVFLEKSFFFYQLEFLKIDLIGIFNLSFLYNSSVFFYYDLGMFDTVVNLCAYELKK